MTTNFVKWSLSRLNCLWHRAIPKWNHPCISYELDSHWGEDGLTFLGLLHRPLVPQSFSQTLMHGAWRLLHSWRNDQIYSIRKLAPSDTGRGTSIFVQVSVQMRSRFCFEHQHCVVQAANTSSFFPRQTTRWREILLFLACIFKRRSFAGLSPSSSDFELIHVMLAAEPALQFGAVISPQTRCFQPAFLDFVFNRKTIAPVFRTPILTELMG